ncbi:MAG TPA: hypothetical protein VKN76_08655 [Kiloniellaceae bacterium]|nr:hypothetical protein [Kiloniellaceae bacterium]
MSVSIKNLQDKTPDPSAPRRPLTPQLAARLDDSLAAVICAAVREHLSFAPDGAEDRARVAVLRFQDIYDDRPVRDNTGGSGFNDSLWLFALACALAPEVVVESGVHKGHSTWLFRQACPDAAIYSFDITLNKRIYIDENTQYFESDWMSVPLPFDSLPARHLIFFDDHISHVQRLREAHDRGFRCALFDDNFPAHQLYATGGPPVPTLAMLFDSDLQPGTEVCWTRNGKAYSYVYDGADMASARGLVRHMAPLPDLAALSRHSLGSGLTLVQLAAAD